VSQIRNRDHVALAIRAQAHRLGGLPDSHRGAPGEQLVSPDALALSRNAALQARQVRDGAADPQAPAPTGVRGFFSRLWEGIKRFFGVTPPPPPRPQAPRDAAAEAAFAKLVGVDATYAQLLVAAGFKSLQQIANTAPETVHAALRAANEKYGVAGRLPSLDTVRAICGDARRLTTPEQPPAPPAEPAEPAIQAWFSDTYQTETAANEATARQHADNPEKRMAKLIDSAKPGGTIDAALFEIDNVAVVDALIRAKTERNVTVRLVIDTDYYYDRKDRTKVAHEVQRLLDAGIPIIQDQRGALMHNKFMVVDKETVWTGSFNVSDSAAFQQNNNAIQLRSAQLAENYTVEFEEMFRDKRFGPTSPRNTPHPVVKIGDVEIETLFAAEDEVNAKLADLVRGAQKQIRFLAFSFTDDQLGDAMLEMAGKGRTIEGVFEKTGGTSKYAEYGKLKGAGLDVHLDGNPKFMHEKVLIIDDSTLVTGSFNFSAGADGDNDENLLIIRNAPELVKRYIAEYERVKATAVKAAAQKASARPVEQVPTRDGAAPRLAA